MKISPKAKIGVPQERLKKEGIFIVKIWNAQILMKHSFVRNENVEIIKCHFEHTPGVRAQEILSLNTQGLIDL